MKFFRHCGMVYQKFCTLQVIKGRNFQKHSGFFGDKKLRAKIMIPPHSCLKFFECQKLPETPKGPPAKFFGTVSQKIFSESCDICLLIRFFDNANFPKHPFYEFFWDTKSFRHLFCATPSVLYSSFCSRQKSSANFELFSACCVMNLNIQQLINSTTSDKRS